MSYLSLGLNLPAQFAVDPWFVVKRAAAQSKASVSCGPLGNLQQFACGLFPINCCRSPKLITWNSTSPLQSEVSEATSPKSSTCLSLPTPRKRPVRRQRLPKILTSDEDCTLDMASTNQVDPKSTSINPTAFIPLTEEQSENFYIFNELLAEHNGSAVSTPSLSTSKLPSTLHNSSRATKRSLSNSRLFTSCGSAPSSKQSKPTLHWSEILDNLMTASDWEEAEEELQKEADQNNATSFNQTVSFIPLTEEESENFIIFNELLAEHQVSSISNPSLSTSKLLSTTSHSQLFTTRAPTSMTPKPTLHWSEILDDLMTASDWEEAEVELQTALFNVTGNEESALNGETCGSVPLEFMPLTSLESSHFDIFNALVLEHQLSETSKSSSSSLAMTNSSLSLNTKTSSKPTPFKLTKRPHWSEILDRLMTDEDREEAEASFTLSLPLCHERPLDLSSTIPSSCSSPENTHSLPTPVEELNDPFEFIINPNQNFCYHPDMSFEIVKSSSNQNDHFAIDLSFIIEKSFSYLDFDC